MVIELGPSRAVPSLVRIAELGRLPAVEAARGALERLRLGGGGELGSLAFIEAWRVESPDADALAVDLGRGAGVEVRAFLLHDLRMDPGGVRVAGDAGAPTTDEDLRDVLPELDGAAGPVLVNAGQVVAWIRAGYGKARSAAIRYPPVFPLPSPAREAHSR